MTGTDGPGADGATLHLNVPSGDPLPEELLRRGIAHLLEHLDVRGGEISVTFLQDRPIRVLNRRHLSHDWVPDVLSFALHGPDEPLLADVYVGLDQARRQAGEHGVPFEEEILRLAIHGVLHTLGYEHPEDRSGRAESPLYRLQERVVSEVTGERVRTEPSS